MFKLFVQERATLTSVQGGWPAHDAAWRAFVGAQVLFAQLQTIVNCHLFDQGGFFLAEFALGRGFSAAPGRTGILHVQAMAWAASSQAACLPTSNCL
jgi:hypothetical protein